MEKTIILALATGQKQFSASLCKLVEKDANILASQGLLTTAMKYLKLLGSNELSLELVILRDRIAHRTWCVILVISFMYCQNPGGCWMKFVVHSFLIQFWHVLFSSFSLKTLSFLLFLRYYFYVTSGFQSPLWNWKKKSWLSLKFSLWSIWNSCSVSAPKYIPSITDTAPGIFCTMVHLVLLVFIWCLVYKISQQCYRPAKLCLFVVCIVFICCPTITWTNYIQSVRAGTSSLINLLNQT